MSPAGNAASPWGLMRQCSYSYRVHTQRKHIGKSVHNRRQEVGKWRGMEGYCCFFLLFFFFCLFFCCFFVVVVVFFFLFFFCCSKHKSLGIKSYIVHSTYKDSWVQDKHKQNSNKGKAEYRQNSQEGPMLAVMNEEHWSYHV